MKETINQSLLEALQPIVTIIIQLASAVLIGIITAGANSLRKKLNLDVSDAEMEDVMETVSDVVNKLNHQIVNDLKEKSADGKLTEDEQREILENAKNLSFSLLDEHTLGFLRKKYGDEMLAIELLVERAIRIFKLEEKKNSQISSGVEYLTETSILEPIPVQQQSYLYEPVEEDI